MICGRSSRSARACFSCLSCVPAHSGASTAESRFAGCPILSADFAGSVGNSAPHDESRKLISIFGCTMGKCSRAKQMKTTILMGRIESRIKEWMKGSQPRALLRLWVVAAASLAVALVFSACENVATYTQPSLVRVIDASYIAPAINVVVEGQLLAANIGQGTITPYGALAANAAAPIDITAATGGAAIVNFSGALLPGHQHSVFLTDNGVAPNGYVVTILEDQQIVAAQGH